MKKLMLMILSVLALFVFAGCGDKDTSTQEAGTKTVAITHKYDTVEVPVNPKKVVTFDFAILDDLDKLGIEVLALPKSGSIPAYLSKYEDGKYENVGGVKEPDYEKLYELKPDVIFISGRQADLYEQFAEIAPTIFVDQDYEDFSTTVKTNMDILAQVFDKEAEVKTILDDLNTKLDAVAAKVNGATALVNMVNEGNMSVYGVGSRFNMVYERLGFKVVDETIESSTHGQKISYEYLLDHTADYMFVVDRNMATGGEPAAQSVIETDVIKNSKVFTEGKVIYVASDIWYLAYSGIQATELMLEEIDAALSK